jgi:membrane-associated phospholipid phosphatase
MNSKPCSLSYRIGILLLFAVAYGLLYVIPNFFSSNPAQELPLLWIDKVIPLIPWTFLIYTSDYFVFLIAILVISDQRQYNSFARMMFGVLLICGMFFYGYPTVYPRPTYEAQSNRLIGSVMSFISVADSPRNCFPSMHVGLTSVATWAMRHKGPKVLAGFALWSVAIFSSTLTTKQHYFYDILGGLGVMTVIAYLEKALFQKDLSAS